VQGTYIMVYDTAVYDLINIITKSVRAGKAANSFVLIDNNIPV